MSRRRKRRRGRAQASALSSSCGPVHVLPGAENGAGHGTGPARGTSISPGRPPEFLPATVPPEALGALTDQIARFNRRLEEIVAQRPQGRHPEDRKETWVLLSALTVVVIFCFVAFYLNQSEMREMQSGLQEDIDRAGHTAVSSLERAISGYHLERLPEAQAAVERLLKEKDRRDGERYQEILEEVRKQSAEAGLRWREELRVVEERLLGLKAAAGLPPTELALENQETTAGRAARGSDGLPRSPLPAPVAGPPAPAGSPQKSTAKVDQESIEPSTGTGRED